MSRKTDALRALAASTTFPAERAAALAKAEQLETDRPPADEHWLQQLKRNRAAFDGRARS